MSESGSQDRRREEGNERHHPYAEAEAEMKRAGDEAEAEGYGSRRSDSDADRTPELTENEDDQLRSVSDVVGRRGHDEPDERTEQH